MKLKVLASVIAVAAALMGCAAPEPVQHVQPVQPVASVQIQEDDPGWDCWIHGNKVCGTNPIERTAAWGAFRAESVPAELQESGFRVSYLGHALEGVELGAGYVTAPSALSPGKVNVFMVEAAK